MVRDVAYGDSGLPIACALQLEAMNLSDYVLECEDITGFYILRSRGFLANRWFQVLPSTGLHDADKKHGNLPFIGKSMLQRQSRFYY